MRGAPLLLMPSRRAPADSHRRLLPRARLPAAQGLWRPSPATAPMTPACRSRVRSLQALPWPLPALARRCSRPRCASAATAGGRPRCCRPSAWRLPQLAALGGARWLPSLPGATPSSAPSRCQVGLHTQPQGTATTAAAALHRTLGPENLSSLCSLLPAGNVSFTPVHDSCCLVLLASGRLSPASGGAPATSTRLPAQLLLPHQLWAPQADTCRPACRV